MYGGIMSQKVTPLLKCFVLFLFIFTAKVLTSRPNENHYNRNGIHHSKPSYYVRTFTKYHHRRTIQWNHDKDHDWPHTHDNPNSKIGKRSVDQNWPPDISDSILDNNIIPWPLTRSRRSLDDSKEKEIKKSGNDLKQMTSDSVRENLANFEKKSANEHGNKLSNVKKYQVKAAIVVTDPPTTVGPTITCLYKIHSVAKSVTPSYNEDRNEQFMVESDSFDTGTVSEIELPTGRAQVEKCSDSRASCYTLWHQDPDGNITVLGQGCWRFSAPPRFGDKCTEVSARLPDTKFCCCTKSFCNADFTSLQEESITIKAESTMKATPAPNPYSNLVASSILALAAIIVTVALLHKFYCKKQAQTEVDKQIAVHRGEVMGSGPDALATGLLCVDNLTLIEHIGQGKFGSVWSGSLGATPVAVKLFTGASAWQREAAIYEMPNLAHPNILRYYGSDTRPTLTEGSREYLIVLELCTSTLRARLQEAPLTWIEFATYAHGLASALAHLHTPNGSKPCIVHRDVNSLNVLVSGSSCRLADFGLATALPHAHPPARLTEAGTLRYLSPEALEGALDLCVCAPALAAVDVFALALVVWEALWRTAPAHRPPAPPYALPYQHHHPHHHLTTHQMQTLVSRNKVRPPLPAGDGSAPGALRLACDTCEDCWDHDAEARLTAVCVEERMRELKQLVSAPPPHILNNLPPRPPDPFPSEVVKNNLSSPRDATAPLLASGAARGESSDTGDSGRRLAPGAAHARLRDADTHKWGFRKLLDKFRKTDTEVSLLPRHQPSVTENNIFDRPGNLVLSQDSFLEPPCLSPPNKTLCPTMMADRFKELPTRESDPNNQIFAVIVPKAKPVDLELRNKRGSSESIDKSVRTSMSSQSMFKSHSESEDSTLKKRLSDNKMTNSASSSRASINLELQYIDTPNFTQSPFELHSDCSSSEDEHLMLLAENGGSKITMQSIPRTDKEVLKESTQRTDFTLNKSTNKYSKLENEYSSPQDKENVERESPVYSEAVIVKCGGAGQGGGGGGGGGSLRAVSALFPGDARLAPAAGRVKTPGDLPAAVRRARRDRLRRHDSTRLSLYDDRMMFGTSL